MPNSQTFNPSRVIRPRHEIEAANRRRQMDEYRAVRAALVQRRIAELSQETTTEASFENMYQKAMQCLYPLSDEAPSTANPSSAQGPQDAPPTLPPTGNILSPQPRPAANTPFVLQGAAELLRRESPATEPPQTPSPSPSAEPNDSVTSMPSSMPDLLSPSPDPSPQGTPPPHFPFRPLDYQGDLDWPLPPYKKDSHFLPEVSYFPWLTKLGSKLKIRCRNRPCRVQLVETDSDDEDMMALLASDNPPKYTENPQYDEFMHRYVEQLPKGSGSPRPGENEEYDQEMTEVVHRVCNNPTWALHSAETFHYGTQGQGSSHSTN